MKVLLELLLIQLCSAGAGILPLIESPHTPGAFDYTILIYDNRGFWDFPFGTEERSG